MVGRIAAKATVQANESETSLRFGGGLNTRASSDEIDDRECADGQNFDLDLGNSQFRPRKPFDLAGTAPNGQRINGFAQLIATDGTISTIIQAGTIVYETDFYTWTEVGIVSSSARLRGPRAHIWNLDDYVLISDVAGVSPVLTWNGTYLNTLAHNLVGTFIAKYIYIDSERVFYANVISNGVATPHVIVASEISDPATISTNQRPTSSLGEGDAWFLPVPDLKPINGMVGAFGLLIFSTIHGEMFKLVGSTAQDYEVIPLHYQSSCDGMESLCFIGNDMVYGRPGRIESLIGVDNYGDVETNDLSVKIADAVTSATDWQIAYSSRHQRFYAHPDGTTDMWVYHKPIADSGLSPWMKWKTDHSMAFQPTVLWSMLDPQTGLEHPYMGDESGNVYRLEGSGDDGDGGTTDIIASRTSKMVSSVAHSHVYDVQGALKYRPVAGEESTAVLTMLWQGESVFDRSIRVPMVAGSVSAVYGGENYYSDGSIYGVRFSGRLARERFAIPGQSNDIQLKIEVSGITEFEINEVYIGFRAAG